MALSASLFLRQSQTLDDDAAADAVDPASADDAFRTEPVHRAGSREKPASGIASAATTLPAARRPPRQGRTHITPDERSDDDAMACAYDPLGDVYDSATSATGERLSEQLDANFENVFPDDTAPQRADAPELLGQWKSMPGGGGREQRGLRSRRFRRQPRDLAGFSRRADPVQHPRRRRPADRPAPDRPARRGRLSSRRYRRGGRARSAARRPQTWRGCSTACSSSIRPASLPGL